MDKSLSFSQIKQESFYLYIGTFFSSLFIFLLPIFLTRLIGPKDYGLITIAIVVVSTVSIFLSLQMSEVVVRFCNDYLVKKEFSKSLAVYYNCLLVESLWGTGIFAITYLSAPVFASFFPQPSLETELIQIYSFFALASIAKGSMVGILLTFKKFKYLSLNEIASNFLRLILPVTMAKFGLKGVVLGFVFAQVCSMIILFFSSLIIILREYRDISASNLSSEWNEIFFFVFHVTISSTFKSIWSYVDILILGILRPPQEVGFYKIGKGLASLLLMLSSPLNRVIYPTLSTLWVKGDKINYAQILQKFSCFMSLIAFPVTIVIFIFADSIVSYLYTPTYIPSSIVLKIIIWGMFLTCSVGWGRGFALSSRQPQYSTILNLYVLGIMLIGCAVFTKDYGYIGVSFVFSFAMGSVSIIWLFLANRTVPLFKARGKLNGKRNLSLKTSKSLEGNQ